MLPDGFSRRDSLLVLQTMARIGSVGTAQGASGRVATPEIMDALKRMERPEVFWDLLYALTDDRILEMVRETRGDVRFSMIDVQAHDVGVYLHQNREEVESLDVLETDQDILTRIYLEGLDEARSRAVFY
jgi:hypothetical protein